MQKQFLFVTTLTPKRLLTPIRQRLFDLYKQALINQKYENWKVLLIGEEDGVDGKFIKLKSNEDWKILKLQYALDYIEGMKDRPDYVIRLDDDDLISPFALEKASKLNFDCYADSYHHFYDSVYSVYSYQKRPWLANTVIHKTEHIFSELGEKKIPLLKYNHNEIWHQYYKNKKIIYADKSEPLYLRILSPTTFSRSGFEYEQKNTADWKQYNTYLNSFGVWKKKMPKDFLPYYSTLHEISPFYNAPPKENEHWVSVLKKIIRE